ncbi:hypothetical protein ABPG75_012807 [Micractinium tetrahymenae]
MVLAWRALTYTVPGRKRQQEPVRLLSDLTGFLLPGQFTALLGPSGCGKTTLLDCWAGRKTFGQLTGEVLYDGEPPTPALLRRHVGYVEQRDTLLPMLTPYEMLLYTAELKHPRSLPAAEKQRCVTQLIEQLGLGRCADTTIGSVLHRGISGGEAKRCNIGIALITRPRVLLVDELTSGLDSYYGGEVALVVKDLVRREGIATAASIHSPSPTTFALFDNVLLLQRGATVYFGPNGTPALDYFAATFPQLRAPEAAKGLADFLVDVTTRAAGDPQTEGMFAAAYAESQLRADNDMAVAELVSSRQAKRQLAASGAASVGAASSLASCGPCLCLAMPLQRCSACGGRDAVAGGSCCGWCTGQAAGTVTPMWWGLLTLYRFRSLRAIKRADFIMPRIGDKILITFLVVTIYWGLGDSLEVAGVASTAATLFLWSMLTAFTSMGILPCLILERPVYVRERADGLYRPITYLCYKISEEVAVGTLPSVAYSALVFYLVRLQGSFLVFWLVYWVSMCVAVSLTLLAGAISPSVDVAGAVLPAYATTLLFFAGFMIPWGQLPDYWRWYATIDHLRYAFGSMMVNQFSGDRDVPYQGGQPVLEFYGLGGASAWLFLLYESLFFWVFAALTWAALAFWRHQRR